MTSPVSLSGLLDRPEGARVPVKSDDRAVEVARLSSRELLGQAREIEIEHAGMLYRLRVTSLGKLILTK